MNSLHDFFQETIIYHSFLYRVVRAYINNRFKTEIAPESYLLRSTLKQLVDLTALLSQWLTKKCCFSLSFIMTLLPNFGRFP